MVQIKYGRWVIGCPQIQWQKEVKFGGPINVSNFGHQKKKKIRTSVRGDYNLYICFKDCELKDVVEPWCLGLVGF